VSKCGNIIFEPQPKKVKEYSYKKVLERV